ncbi:MAG TPA: glycosyltransferase family 4 protein [Saprospiraceae bacterium]|nr:glycosyltransferase family 4 protein [Lacibacter sp.]HMO89986.1 glycosyltransferase family 4 protein [Lacibacter sp.]HMQ08615.1 glycosyltransferase family 4 protein [Saprospiraceae bacterium]
MNESKRHIVFVLQRLQTGGAERQVSYLASYLQNQNNKVSVVYFGTAKPEAAKWFQERNLTIIPIGFNEKLLFQNKGSFAFRLKKKYLLLKLFLFFKRLQPTTVLPFTYEPNILLGRYWKFTCAQACIWNQRDVGLYFSGTTFEKKALMNCSHWAANSPASAAFLQQQGIKTMTVIPNAVPLLQKQAASPGASIRVLMIGNLHVNKDHITLLRAWKLVMEQNKGADLQLLLAGGSGNNEVTVRQFIKEEQLEDSVQLLGLVSDIQQLIATATIGVLSSKAEGLPNAVLECMAGGLPVVATNNEGCRFALGNEYPFLSSVDDAVGLAEHLVSLIHSSELRLFWGQYNHKRIAEHFSEKKMGEAFRDMIEQLQ